MSVAEVLDKIDLGLIDAQLVPGPCSLVCELFMIWYTQVGSRRNCGCAFPMWLPRSLPPPAVVVVA